MNYVGKLTNYNKIAIKNDQLGKIIFILHYININWGG